MPSISATGSVMNTVPYRFIRSLGREESQGIAIDTERLEYALGILELFLGISFLFNLFNASSLNLLNKVVEVVTFPFIAPFYFFFGKNAEYALTKIELMTLAAMVVYPIVVWASVYIIKNGRKKTSITHSPAASQA